MATTPPRPARRGRELVAVGAALVFTFLVSRALAGQLQNLSLPLQLLVLFALYIASFFVFGRAFDLIGRR